MQEVINKIKSELETYRQLLDEKKLQLLPYQALQFEIGAMEDKERSLVVALSQLKFYEELPSDVVPLMGTEDAWGDVLS